MSLAIMESKLPETVSPSRTPASTRTPGPAGRRKMLMRPGAGMKPPAGSSPLIRNSIEWPRTWGLRLAIGSPAAMRNCSRTRSTPVTSSVTGVDLVREQFRIAAGEPIANLNPQVRGHSIEFRINGEDPAGGFMPAPGRINILRLPAGPGVRVDAGVREGDTVSGNFDSMIAKLIVTGATRAEAIQRARRAVSEFVVKGIPTVLPFHAAVLDAPEFVGEDGYGVYTTWIETGFAETVKMLGPSGGA